jgi:hypothetical protein
MLAQGGVSFIFIAGIVVGQLKTKKPCGKQGFFIDTVKEQLKDT